MPIPGAVTRSSPQDSSAAPQRLDGRDEERAMLVNALLEGTNNRIAVTGHAGIGKSRLVYDVCSSLSDHFPGGVWFADLRDTLRAPTLAWGILQAFGARPAAHDSPDHTVLAMLANRKPLLLVLDGYERFADGGAAFIEECVRRAPDSKILLTARGDECCSDGMCNHILLHTLKAPPHPVPGADYTAQDVEALKGWAAAKVLLRGIEQVKPDFALTPTVARACAVVCSVLEGLPLALEIVAARANEVEVVRIAPQIEHKRAFLASQQPSFSRYDLVLATAVEWSYEFLPEWAKLALEQMSVFDAPFDGATAEAVLSFPDMGGSEFVERVLKGLCRMKLLAMYEGMQGTKYVLHDGVRAVVHDSWLERANVEEDRQLKDRYALQKVRVLEHLDTSQGSTDMIALQADSQLEAHTLLKLQDRWYGTRDAEERVRTLSPQLKTALSIGLMNASEYDESLAMANQAAKDARESKEWYALGAALQHMSTLYEHQGDYASALRVIDEAQEAFSHVDAAAAQASLSLSLGRIHTRRGEFRQALQALASAKQMFRDLGLRRGEADAQLEAGRLLHLRGELQAALRCFEIAQAIFREEGKADRLALAATLRASTLAPMGRFEDAREAFEHAILVSTEQGDRLSTANHQLAYGHVLRLRGQYEEAQKYVAEAEDVFRELGVKAPLAAAMAEYGLLNRELGYYRDAIERQRVALRMNRQLHQRHGVMETQLNLGTTLMDMARYDDSRHPLKRASILAQGFEDVAARAVADAHLALLELYAGDLRLALAMEKETRKITDGLDDVYVKSFVYGISGEIRLASDELELARELLEESLSIAKEFGFESKIPCFRANVALAEAYWRLGELELAKLAAKRAWALSSLSGITGNRRLTRSREFMQRLQLLQQYLKEHTAGQTSSLS